MLKEFKNVKVNYEADAIIDIGGKSYKIHDCIEGEDILVETEGNILLLLKLFSLAYTESKTDVPIRRNVGDANLCIWNIGMSLNKKRSI